jgi:hypothetical protein
MKKIAITVERLQCDQCSFSCSNQHEMEEHEKTHLQLQCEHTDLHYSLHVLDDYDGLHRVHIECKCKDCLIKVQASVSESNQKNLREIFNTLGRELWASQLQKIKRKEETKKEDDRRV